MFEPLLRVTLPDHIAERGKLEVALTPGMTRRVVIISQAWLLRRAEVSAKEIVEHLVASGRVDLVATGDYSCEAQLVRPSVLEAPAEVERRRKLEEERLARPAQVRMTDLPTYLALALPARVPLVGVNDGALERAAIDGREARSAAVRELFERGREIGIDSGYDDAGPHFAHYDTLKDQNRVAREPIPILGRLRERAEEIKASLYPDDLARADVLLANVRASLKNLPSLLRFARRRGLRVEKYRAVVAVEKNLAAENVSPWRLRGEWRWLRRAVLDRLVSGRLDRHGGLMALFERDLRLALRGEAKHNPFDSHRPLHDATRAEIKALALDLADVAERNEAVSTHVLRKMLDLASLFGLNDRNFLRLRRLAAAQSELVGAAAFIQQREALERDLIRCVAGRGTIQLQLVQMIDWIDDLDRMGQEELGAAEAKRVLRHAPPAAEIAAFLRTLGAVMTPAEQQQVHFFDSDCAPPARRFYQASLDQARRMAQALLTHLGSRGGTAAVLLCGGFHTPGIVAELSENQVACSTVLPAMTQKDEMARVIDPQEVRNAAQGPSVTIHHIGPTVADYVRGRRAPESGPLPDTERTDSTDGKQADSKDWIEQRWMQTVMGELQSRMENESALGVANECRVCRRQARVGAQRVVSGQRVALDLVLECLPCQSFICTRCAGRAPLAMLPGHGAADAQRALRFAGALVCNLHAIPLGPPSKRRWVSGRYPGHSWFA